MLVWPKIEEQIQSILMAMSFVVSVCRKTFNIFL